MGTTETATVDRERGWRQGCGWEQVQGKGQGQGWLLLCLMEQLREGYQALPGWGEEAAEKDPGPAVWRGVDLGHTTPQEINRPQGPALQQDPVWHWFSPGVH